jgi:1A family penicillin-binding protein
MPVVQKFNRMTRKRKIVLIGWTGGSILILLALFTTVIFANTLGSKERIMNRNKTGVTLLDQNDTVFYTFYNAHSNTYVPLSKISKSAKNAVIASEDKDFYEHAGFSPKGIINAVWQNIRPGGLNNGGSTITQQLVKTALLSEQRSYIRKYQELVLSIEIERRYSKDEILEMYLNSVYFGEGAFGIEDASQVYFGKPAETLTTAEAALLIGLLPAPSAYSPISGDPAKAKTRQDYVLGRMEDDNFITNEEGDSALQDQLTYVGKKSDAELRAPHFALMVKEELEKRYGEERIARSGYTLKTTLNADIQNKAEKAVTSQVDRLARNSVSNGGAVVIDPKTGEVRALVGSKDWNNELFGKYNIATASRQPGSSFKPIVYGAGIENKIFSAATIFEDKAIDFGGYAPKNYDLRYRGDVTLRRALANSLNIPAVSALQKTGIHRTKKTAEALGLTTLNEESYDLTMALGSSQAKLTEMTNAYATFANGGKKNELTLIASIVNKDKKNIFTYKPANKQVISPQTSYILTSILSDSTARSESFGNSLNLNNRRTAAVKTGTTEDYRDAWAIGYTPSLATGVWIGNNDNSAMSSIAGSSGAAPIWKNIMQQVLANSTTEQFSVPSGLTKRTICRANGALAQSSGANTMTEYFVPGTLPAKRCNEIQKEATPPAVKPKEEDSSANDNSNSNNGTTSSSSGPGGNDNTTPPEEDEDTNPTNPNPPNPLLP